MKAPETSWTAKIEFPNQMVRAEDRSFVKAVLAGAGVVSVAVLPGFEVKALMGGVILLLLLIFSGLEWWAERHARLRQLACSKIVPRGEYHQVTVEGVKYRSQDGRTWYSAEGRTLEWDLSDKLRKIVAVRQVWPGT